MNQASDIALDRRKSVNTEKHVDVNQCAAPVFTQIKSRVAHRKHDATQTKVVEEIAKLYSFSVLD